MIRRLILCLLRVKSLAGVFLIPVLGQAADSARPNIIVIITDDQGYHDVGFHGCEDIPTPNMDALARGGAECTDGYVTCPVCAPSRAGLLTGRYQQRFGFDDNSWSTKTGLSTDETTVADYLKSAGYATIAIGKWHEGQLPQFRPLVRGFTDHYGFLGGGRSFFPKDQSVGVLFVPKDPDQIDLWRNEDRVEDPEYLTDGFGDAAVEYIGEYKDRPFFLYVAFNAPHVPLQATEKYLTRFPSTLKEKRRTYAAMVSAVDDAVGRISEKLRAEGLEKNTLIFFLTDNGGHPIANAARNTPLRGEKGTTWEGGIRVPFIVKWKGRIPAGIKYSEPVISLDITATALGVAGITPSPDRPLDGVNLIPYLTGEKTGVPHGTLYWRFVEDWAVRHGNWKLTMSPDKLPKSSLPESLQDMGSDSERPTKPGLFDLSRDISESRDLSDERPEVLRELQELYDSWNAELPPPQARAVRGSKAPSRKLNSTSE